MRTDKKEEIREFSGKILGFIESNSRTGEALARDFYGRILGTYDPTYNLGKGCTRDFYGRIVGYGNQLQGLIWNPTVNKRLDAINKKKE